MKDYAENESNWQTCSEEDRDQVARRVVKDLATSLAPVIGEAKACRWFYGVEFRRLEGRTLHLSAPGGYQAQYVEANFGHHVVAAARRAGLRVDRVEARGARCW